MHGYLYRNYFFIAYMISIVMLVMLYVGGFPFGYSLFVNAFIWGGLLGGYLVVVYFRHRNVWLLFLNLRIAVFFSSCYSHFHLSFGCHPFDFYLLDEPFTGVSPILIERMMRAVREKKEQGRGVLLTDHYTRYVKMVADDLYELGDGYCRRQ